VGGTWPRQLAIAAHTWLAVLFDAIFGPDVASTTHGESSTTIPSAIVLAVFAYLSTRAVATRKPRPDTA
jgi:hypothetical protein